LRQVDRQVSSPNEQSIAGHASASCRFRSSTARPSAAGESSPVALRWFGSAVRCAQS
jgi:hypothetical protein